jgi:asparagine N-glycosylation enzyme membrane subunit Stt3
MLLALLLALFGFGLLLGALTQVRFGVLLVPPVAVALAYWLKVGWQGDAYDFGREGLVLVTGAIGALFVASWAAGIGIARAARERLSREAPGSRRARGTDPPAASRR